MTVIQQITLQLQKNEKKWRQHKEELEHLKSTKTKLYQQDLKNDIQEMIKLLQRQIVHDKTEIRICEARLRALQKASLDIKK